MQAIPGRNFGSLAAMTGPNLPAQLFGRLLSRRPFSRSPKSAATKRSSPAKRGAGLSLWAVLGAGALGLAPSACKSDDEASASTSTQLFARALYVRGSELIQKKHPQLGQLPETLITHIQGPGMVKINQKVPIRLNSRVYNSSGEERILVFVEGTLHHYIVKVNPRPSPASDPAPSFREVVLEIGNRAELAGTTARIGFAFLDESNRAGPAVYHELTVLRENGVNCPDANACIQRSCGLDPICAESCGAPCPAGQACRMNGQCEAMGSGCPELAQCGDRQCGLDPVCATPCGSPCATGLRCDDKGQCVVSSAGANNPGSTSPNKGNNNAGTPTGIPSWGWPWPGGTGTKKDKPCPAGQVRCEGKCINPNTNALYCGARGNCSGLNRGYRCDDNEMCVDGRCRIDCPQGFLLCGQQCIDPEKDLKHCGAKLDCEGANAGKSCSAGQVCSAGTCKIKCPAGKVLCNDECIDPLTSNLYCGAMGNCEGMQAGSRCEAQEVCDNGKCDLRCSADQVKCEGRCINPLEDRKHCGASGSCEGNLAGEDCGSDRICVKGRCRQDCEEGLVECDGKCIDPQQNNNFCGARKLCEGLDKGQRCRLDQACRNASCVDLKIWAPSEALFGNNFNLEQHSAISNKDGKILVAWAQKNASNSDPELKTSLFDAKSGRFGQAVTVSDAPNTPQGPWAGGPWLATQGEDYFAMSWARSIGSEGTSIQSNLWSENWRNTQVVATHADLLQQPVQGSFAVDSARHRYLWWRSADGERLALTRSQANLDGPFGEATAVSLPRDRKAEFFNTVALGDRRVLALVVTRNPEAAQNQAWTLYETIRDGDGDWGELIEIKTVSRDDWKGAPQLVADREGKVTAVWAQEDSGRSTIWAARRDPKQGWSQAIRLESEAAIEALDPQISIDPSGRVAAVWRRQGGDARQALVATRLDSEPMAARPIVVPRNRGTLHASPPAIVSDPNGNLSVIWTEDDGTTTNIWANYFDATAQAFGVPRLVEQNGPGAARGPVALRDEAGNAVVLWTQVEGDLTHLWYARQTLHRP